MKSLGFALLVEQKKEMYKLLFIKYLGKLIKRLFIRTLIMWKQ